MSELNICIIQPEIAWEDKGKNLDYYEQRLAEENKERELVILPEMFSTGFSMEAVALAETMEGPTVDWMKRMARRYRVVITGSLIISEEGRYCNRLLWVLPNGELGWYDKRHLFGYGGEKARFSAGSKRLIAQLKGFRICLQICYDLRFPVWSRNREAEYDLLINVANWPSARIEAWDTLLRARAIENQSYVIGVNRVGRDPLGNHYPGHSQVIDPLGEILWKGGQEALIYEGRISLRTLKAQRRRYPFLDDADRFSWG